MLYKELPEKIKIVLDNELLVQKGHLPIDRFLTHIPCLILYYKAFARTGIDWGEINRGKFDSFYAFEAIKIYETW